MRKLARRPIQISFAIVFSFVLGCIFTSSIVPMDKPCIQGTDREYMKNSKFKNPDLIILILSGPGNSEKRKVIRNTWLKLSNPEVNDHQRFQFKHYFVVGDLGVSASHLHGLKQEQSKFDDILILPIYDTYKNLTLKVKKSFEWLSEQYDNDLSFKYVLKCDDDTFVSMEKLISELMNIDEILIGTSHPIQKINDWSKNYVSTNIQRNEAGSSSNFHLYWGYFSGSARIKTKGKWKEINWIASDHYLPYALGGGYLLSKDLVTLIGKMSANLRSFNSEDVSVGMWLAPINNVVRIHDIRFDTEWVSRGCKNTHLITHNITPIEMAKLFNNLMTIKRMCSEETTRRKHYMYDWKVPNSQCCRVSNDAVIKLP